MHTTKESQSKDEWGLDFARKLDFTESHYEEALKLIKSPNNTNQLLLALLDVSGRGGQAPSNLDTSRTQFVSRSKSIDTSTRPNLNRESQQPQSMQGVKHRSLNSSASNTGTSSTSGSSSNLIYFPNSDAIKNDSDTESGFFQKLNSPQQTNNLRKIYIDGSNVAKAHGKDVEFSWPGIRICVEWFRNRGHSVIKVFVPETKCQSASSMTSLLNSQSTSADSHHEMVLDYLIRMDALVKTPVGSNDDMFLIEAAILNDGVIVSNDHFREESRCSDELQNYIAQNKLSYIFDDDNFIPAYDPLGRYGPSRDQFLRTRISNISSIHSHHDKLYRAQSNQRFERHSVYYPFKHQIGNSLAFQRRSLQHTHSLPLQGPHESIKNDNRKLGNESVESINLYQLQRSARDDLNRMTSNNRFKFYGTSSSNSISDNNKPNESHRGNSSIPHRNALIRTKSHN